MMQRDPFTLVPFETMADDFQLCGAVVRDGRILDIEYVLTGPLARVVLDPPAACPQRRDQLWQATCFECFVTRAGSPSYREFNFSPAGHWNLYRFDDYRAGMRPDAACDTMAVRTDRRPDRFRLRCRVDLDPLGLARQAIRMGVSAILKTTDPGTLHWALAHTGPKPDFHRQDAFTMDLQAERSP